jgi:hypothetical protein
VTFVNFVAVLDALRTVALLDDAWFSGRAIMPELPVVIWPMELWIASVLFSQWAVRNRRPNLAVIVAVLALIALEADRFLPLLVNV